MRYISQTRLFAIKSNVRLLLSAVFVLLVTGCASSEKSRELDSRSSKYSTDSLAKDWREQVRSNPTNPFEGRTYPADNDSEYMPPRKGSKVPHGGGSSLPVYDNDDSNYGRFPRYNPDDDNMPIDPKHYPLYME